MSEAVDRCHTERLESVESLQCLAVPGWMYRGHGCAEWPLRSTLERCCDRHDLPNEIRQGVELELLREFRRAFHQHSAHLPDPSLMLEWLALMQHHGAPTRMLDFSYSVHVAAYFATEKTPARPPEDHSGDAAIWAVNYRWAIGESIRLLQKGGVTKKEAERLDETFCEKGEAKVTPLLWAEKPNRFAVPLNPFRLNQRLRIQKGVFWVPGSANHTFEENLLAMRGHRQRKNVKRIVIPRGLGVDLRAVLFRMNISRHSLFPGLDGYARSLGVYHGIFDEKEPIRRRLSKTRCLS